MACSYNSDKAVFLNASKSYVMTGEENMASSVAHEGPITVGFGVSQEFMLLNKGNVSSFKVELWAKYILKVTYMVQ